MRMLIKATKSIVALASVQLERYSQKTRTETSKAKPYPTVLQRSRAVKSIQYAILCAIASIVAVKLNLLLHGMVDPIVGIYEVVIISNAFMPFFFAFTQYKDPSILRRDNKFRASLISRKIDQWSKPKTFRHSAARAGSPLVSVVIPVYNEVKLIASAVDAVVKSSYPRTEIIIIDDCSTDGSGEVIDSIAARSPGKVKVLHMPYNMGKRRAIREGIIQGKAAGEIFVFIDSDCVVDHSAIERLVLAFADNELGAVAGHGKVLEPDRNVLSKLQDTWYDGQFSVMKGMESAFGTVTCCPGILSAYRRDALMPCLEAWCSETFLGKPFDSGDDRQMTSYVFGGTKHYVDSGQRVWKVKYSESAVVSTEVPSNIGQFIKQQIRWKKSWIRAFVFTLPFFYKNRSPFVVASFYIQVAASFIAPLIAFRSLVVLPLEGVYLTPLSYVAGVLFIDLLFAIEYKLRNKGSGDRWSYRLLFSFLSIAILDWLIYYSLLTIRNNSWLTRAAPKHVRHKSKVAV